MNERIIKELKDFVSKKEATMPHITTWAGLDLKIKVFKPESYESDELLELDAPTSQIGINVKALKKADASLFFLLAWSVYRHTTTEEFLEKYASQVSKLKLVDSVIADSAADAQAYQLTEKEYPSFSATELLRDFMEVFIKPESPWGVIRYYRIKEWLIGAENLKRREEKEKEKKIEMEPGKIYFISFGGTEVIGRYEKDDMCNYHFFAHLHYWNGFESFHPGGYCVKHGIELIRRATPAEMHNLLRFEIAKETI